MSFFSQPVHAMNLSFYGLTVFPHGSTTGNPHFITSAGNEAYGGGLSLEYSLARSLGFEVGLFYAPRGMKYKTELTTESALTFKTLTLPVLIRLAASKTLTLGVGGYYSYSLESHPQMGQLGSLTQNDLGLVASINLRLPIFSWGSFIADARYLYGMTSLSRFSDSQVYLRDVQVLCGLSIKIQ